jgi:hypothetical protein
LSIFICFGGANFFLTYVFRPNPVVILFVVILFPPLCRVVILLAFVALCLSHFTPAALAQQQIIQAKNQVGNPHNQLITETLLARTTQTGQYSGD